ncbi:hypothetical protein BX661DRAFT_187137 [Kickxella alabastrina]|uniref:uncharacterized protein n=1 Tax=Kickxella alabastrina TaxID=61397 RepID=UPI00221F09CB|nr:uncharacterized protein BX661DRAFT_187137 [Kickxella alabastrina]KAI7822776.1 hypothetical protein BX661DRAFT_187137 [Kickxella alabastrina]
MLLDTQVILKVTLGALSACVLFSALVLFFYNYRIYFTPWPHRRRWHRRDLRWTSVGETHKVPPVHTLTLGEIEGALPAQPGSKGCCLVCLEDIKEGVSVRALGCGHSFHIPCIDPWLTTNASCPACRKNINTK